MHGSVATNQKTPTPITFEPHQFSECLNGWYYQVHRGLSETVPNTDFQSANQKLLKYFGFEKDLHASHPPDGWMEGCSLASLKNTQVLLKLIISWQTHKQHNNPVVVAWSTLLHHARSICPPQPLLCANRHLGATHPAKYNRRPKHTETTIAMCESETTGFFSLVEDKMQIPWISKTKRGRIYCRSADMGGAASELHVSCSTVCDLFMSITPQFQSSAADYFGSAAHDSIFNLSELFALFSHVRRMIIVPPLMTE